MKKPNHSFPTLILSACLVTTVAGPSTANEVLKGKKLAQTHCARCHVVGDFNPHGGISSTPSLQLIVNALKDWKERYNTFYKRPPHPAVIKVEGIKKPNDLPYNAAPITLTRKDIKNITAYVETLKKK